MSVSGKLSSLLPEISECEKEKNIAERKLDEIKVTLRVNYGPGGKAHPDVILGEEPPMQMLMKVLNFYEGQ